jgi:hypothetical protein
VWEEAVREGPVDPAGIPAEEACAAEDALVPIPWLTSWPVALRALAAEVAPGVTSPAPAVVPATSAASSAAEWMGSAGAVASLAAGFAAPPVLPPLAEDMEDVPPLLRGAFGGVRGVSLIGSASSFWSGGKGQRSGGGAEEPQ